MSDKHAPLVKEERSEPPAKRSETAPNKQAKSLRLGKDCKYDEEIDRLQIELVKLQEWIKAKGLRLVVLFEGRDAAGKGGAIKRITQSLNPRICRVVALGMPTEREKTQWYFQRYVAHLPAAGEMALFDRSWYNRAGVEHVMGFCTKKQYKRFLELCPYFERHITTSGIRLLKFWLEVSNKEQERRFRARVDDPLRQWKLSPMDLPSREKWYEYSRARDAMLKATDRPYAPWHLVRSDDKRRARLNCIAELLHLVPYKRVSRPKVKIPNRSRKHAYNDEASIARRRFVRERY